MEWLVAACELAAVVAVVLLGAMLLAYRVVHGLRNYFRFRGTRLLTCPETHTAAAVQVAAGSMGLQSILGEPRLRLSKCSRGPMRGGGCAQDCLSQIESHSSELGISQAWKTI
jgi:hypothetical protein